MVVPSFFYCAVTARDFSVWSCGWIEPKAGDMARHWERTREGQSRVDMRYTYLLHGWHRWGSGVGGLRSGKQELSAGERGKGPKALDPPTHTHTHTNCLYPLPLSNVAATLRQAPTTARNVMRDLQIDPSGKGQERESRVADQAMPCRAVKGLLSLVRSHRA